MQKNFCPYCGKKLAGGERFCGKCGKYIAAFDKPERQTGVIKQTGVYTKKTKLLFVEIAVVVFLFVGSIVLAMLGYFPRDSRMILGTWNQIDEYGYETGNSLTFNEDGTVCNAGMEAEYEIDDGEIYMTYTGGWDIERHTFEYELRWERLILTDIDSGNSSIFVKK